LKTIEVKELRVNSSGEKEAHVLLDKGFKAWFLEQYSLKRWSSKKFQSVFLASLEDHQAFEGVVKIVASFRS
jgi:hypothetical protein